MGRKLKSSIPAIELANYLGLELIYGDAIITSVEGVEQSGIGSLCFAKNETWVSHAQPGGILLTANEAAKNRLEPTIISNAPRLDFARALAYLESTVGFRWDLTPPKVHATARIGQHVVLGNGVEIGEGSVIYHHVVIGDEVKIGRNCVIKSCAVIGEEGFGFERAVSGKAIRLPHIGSVLIGNNVEVGSLTTVCRGTLGNTVIEDGAKIDDHVHIAHNVIVGQDAFVIACAEVSGGVRIGKRAWIAPNACIMNQVIIGDDAVVGLGGVVIKNVTANSVVAGNPAKPLSR